ncbi:MAG: hypothetical protein ACOC31_03275 [Bacteroidota bacterium]
MNLVSSIFGFVSLVIAIVGFFPLLGWLNWIALFFAFIGAFFGVLARYKNGRNLNILVIVIAMFRLWIGGGFI